MMLFWKRCWSKGSFGKIFIWAGVCVLAHLTLELVNQQRSLMYNSHPPRYNMKPAIFPGCLGLGGWAILWGNVKIMVPDLVYALLLLYKTTRSSVGVGGQGMRGAISKELPGVHRVLQGKLLLSCTAVAIILSSQKQHSPWPFQLNLPIPFPDLFLLGERLRIIKKLHNFPPFLLSLKLYWFTDHKTPATQKEESARSQRWEGE